MLLVQRLLAVSLHSWTAWCVFMLHIRACALRAYGCNGLTKRCVAMQLIVLLSSHVPAMENVVMRALMEKAAVHQVTCLSSSVKHLQALLLAPSLLVNYMQSVPVKPCLSMTHACHVCQIQHKACLQVSSGVFVDKTIC